MDMLLSIYFPPIFKDLIITHFRDVDYTNPMRSGRALIAARRH
jgi:hypothetical protein